MVLAVYGYDWLAGGLPGFAILAAGFGTTGRSVSGLLAALAAVHVCFAPIWGHGHDTAFNWAAVCGVMFALSLWPYRRPVAETLLEWPIRLMYRLRAVGPGMDLIPRTGPVLVVANHPSYLDPCWIMIRLPRDLTPMMYVEYFNIPGVHFYMKHLIGAIPACAAKFRREAPELDEAVRRLDRGEGVLLFPEGWVRRTEEDGLRRFGQGAWRILRDRPATPVVACWVEGGWGSWASFQDGPPFKGWPDLRRPIDIGVTAPVVLDAATLADQHRTRDVLREMVLAARQFVPGCR